VALAPLTPAPLAPAPLAPALLAARLLGTSAALQRQALAGLRQ